MKTTAAALLIVMLTIIFLTGCRAQYSAGMKTDSPRTKIYYQRADGLRIPTYVYLQ